MKTIQMLKTKRSISRRFVLMLAVRGLLPAIARATTNYWNGVGIA